MSATWSYARVSHRNSLDGYSLEAQDIAARERWEMLSLPDWGQFASPGERRGSMVDRAVSAYKIKMPDRPEGRRLMEKVGDGDHVLFYSVCRGFRNLADWAHVIDCWMKRGITAHFIKNGIRTDTAAGWMIGSVMAIYAQWKGMIIAERHKMAKAFRAAGHQVGYERKNSGKGAIGDEMSRRIVGILDERKILPMPARHGRVWGYARCSDVEQVATGISAAAQTEMIQRYSKGLERNGAEWSGVFYDPEVSAWSVKFPKRPAGKKLLDALQPGDHVVALRVDRVFRSLPDMVETARLIHEKGAFLHIVDSGVSTATSEGRALIGIMTIMAELESYQTSQMTKDGMAARRARGIIDHLPPYLKWDYVGPRRYIAVDQVRYDQIREVRPLLEAGKYWGTVDALEEMDAARFEDGRVIPRGGFPAPFARKHLDPDHGDDNLNSRRRWWNTVHVENIRRDVDGWYDKMERVVAELGV